MQSPFVAGKQDTKTKGKESILTNCTQESVGTARARRGKGDGRRIFLIGWLSNASKTCAYLIETKEKDRVVDSVLYNFRSRKIRLGEHSLAHSVFNFDPFWEFLALVLACRQY